MNEAAAIALDYADAAHLCGDSALAGSSVPPVFAPSSPVSRRPLQVGEGGAAFGGGRS